MMFSSAEVANKCCYRLQSTINGNRLWDSPYLYGHEHKMEAEKEKTKEKLHLIDILKTQVKGNPWANGEEKIGFAIKRTVEKLTCSQLIMSLVTYLGKKKKR